MPHPDPSRASLPLTTFPPDSMIFMLNELSTLESVVGSIRLSRSHNDDPLLNHWDMKITVLDLGLHDPTRHAVTGPIDYRHN